MTSREGLRKRRLDRWTGSLLCGSLPNFRGSELPSLLRKLAEGRVSIMLVNRQYSSISKGVADVGIVDRHQHPIFKIDRCKSE